MENFFPFRLYSDNTGKNSPYDFRSAFNANRPEIYEVTEKWGTFVHTRTERFSYYCYDVIVHSQTDIEFVCFGMEDFCYGGKGKEFHRFKATVKKEVTSDSIMRRSLRRAEYRREDELAEAERKIIERYAEAERKALGISFI